MFDDRIVSDGRYTPSLDIKKSKIQCDQGNINEVERGDVERAKMGGY